MPVKDYRLIWAVMRSDEIDAIFEEIRNAR